MAIVINGSGTVTGLAVGGLPDGTVDAGTLATNSVDSAELVDGAVDDSHIGTLAASKLTGALPAISGASLTGLTSAQMPSGSVLQVVSTQNNALNSTTNANPAAYSSVGLSVDITPKSSNSKFLITVTVGQGTTVGSNSWGLTLFRDSSRSSLNGNDSGTRKGCFVKGVDHAGSNGADDNHCIGAMNHGVDTTSGTAGTTITFKAGGVTEGGTMYINRNESNSENGKIYSSRASTTISVMEVEK